LGKQFTLKGLNGKGLGISAKGTHVAFVGGTGVLVFLDLVALLLRMNLGLLDGDSAEILDQKSFKLVLFLSFSKR
jgi:hypothetical protein